MYVLDIDVTRNGNNLKLKVKSEFSLSMGLMVINHSNPYIHSTTVLCDKRRCITSAHGHELSGRVRAALIIIMPGLNAHGLQSKLPITLLSE